jgi:hypothetical protein
VRGALDRLRLRMDRCGNQSTEEEGEVGCAREEGGDDHKVPRRTMDLTVCCFFEQNSDLMTCR